MTTQPTVQNKKSSAKILPADDSHGARNLINLLLLAWKICGLYPDGHTASIKAIENLMAGFRDFFSINDTLPVMVERNRLLCGKTIVHEVPPEAPFEDIVFPLYRDGIKLLTFRKGLQMNELVYFFQTLNKHRILMEEAEGDVVTGLIDGDLAHIDFETVDIFWEDYPLLDFSDLNFKPPDGDKYSDHDQLSSDQQAMEAHRSETYAKSIADPSLSSSLWEISQAERKELQKMVQEEEHWDNTEDVFDVLLVILQSQTDRDNFSSVLDFILEEVVDSIEQGEFKQLLNLFQALHHMLYKDVSAGLGWTHPLINRFFEDLSKPEMFDLLTGELMVLNDGDTEKIQALRQVLLYFSPEVISSLGPVILRSGSAPVRRMLMEVIGYLSLRDMGPIEKIYEQQDRALGEKLLPVACRFKGGRSIKLFFKMTRHPSKNVRREAVRILLSSDPQYVQKLFFLIDDTSDSVRKDILGAIAKQRSTELESMLLKYLADNIDRQTPEHIRACYEALGSCGSTSSVPFLREILLGRGWDLFKKSEKTILREGAANALALLDNQEALDILQTASKSKFKVIRLACQRAMAGNDTTGAPNND